MRARWGRLVAGAAVFVSLVLAGRSSLGKGPPAESRSAEPAADAPALAGSDWPLEKVTLVDGKVFVGLVQAEGPTSIEFVEVRRPRGKPMFLVVRPIDKKAIASSQRLSAAEQQDLRAKLEKHRFRALVEGRRMEDLAVSHQRKGEALEWEYQGQLFSLSSTADEAMTRRLIVRLGQIFTAYQQLFPPRATPNDRVHIHVYGAVDQYRAALKEAGLEIKNPAVYLADRNLILAGSELNRFDAELAAVNRQHRQIKQDLDKLVGKMPNRLKDLSQTLKDNGIDPAERVKILQAEQRKWEEQRRAARKKITVLERKNAARFDEVAGQMYRRLAHEAFHAYLEVYVYPRDSYDVPRWLNEGLAQTFEGGLLEADTLRIDAPNVTALAQLQSDLGGCQPLELAELLNAGSETFLSAHAAAADKQSRSYYYSWGLAYYLVFDLGILGTPEFEAYLSPAAANLSNIERFEKLVGQPLDRFEKRWRQAMLQLKPAT